MRVRSVAAAVRLVSMARRTSGSFREALAGEDLALTRLERSANLLALGHVFPPDEYPYPTGEVRERWQGLLRDASVLVGVCEDAVGLTAVVAFDTELLRHLAVRPDAWGTGLARSALDWATRQAPVRRLWCLEENTRALGFYGHLGWTPTGARQRAEFPPYPVEIELSRPSEGRGRRRVHRDPARPGGVHGAIHMSPGV